jgi:hypothetical protein
MTVHNHPTLAAIKKVDAQLQENVEKYGWTFIGVFDPEGLTPSFVYTVGLTEKGLPEVFMSGNFAPQSMQNIVNMVAQKLVEHAEQGTAFHHGVRTDLFNFPVDLRYVEDTEKCNKARAWYGDRVRVLQIVWSDDNGHFPNDPLYKSEQFPQEILPTIQ